MSSFRALLAWTANMIVFVPALIPRRPVSSGLGHDEAAGVGLIEAYNIL
jgi:hypothetical protein